MDGDTAVVAPLVINPHSGRPLDAPDMSQQIHLLHKTLGGELVTVQQIDVDYQPRSMTIFADTMIVGSPWESLETGAAYVYNRNISGLWHQTQCIVPDDNQIDAEFGEQV